MVVGGLIALVVRWSAELASAKPVPAHVNVKLARKGLSAVLVITKGGSSIVIG